MGWASRGQTPSAGAQGSKIGRSSHLTCLVSGAYWRIIVVYFVVVGQRGHLGGVLRASHRSAPAPSWRGFAGSQGRERAARVFELKQDALHSLTSLGWRLASHSIGHGPEDGATGCGLSVSAPNVLSECVSASFAVCQGSRLISVAQSGVDTRRERADASIKVVLGRSNALGMAGNEPS